MLALETRAENESSSLGGAPFLHRSPEETGVCQPVKPALSLERAKSSLTVFRLRRDHLARGFFSLSDSRKDDVIARRATTHRITADFQAVSPIARRASGEKEIGTGGPPLSGPNLPA